MGMYTEVFVSCALRSNIRDVDLMALKHMFDHGDLPARLPDHPFFKCPRWHWVGNTGSYYFTPEAFSKLWWDDNGNNWYLTSRSDLKNYDGEVPAFWDWFRSLAHPYGDMIGYHRYEEDAEPTIVKALDE